MIMELQFSPFVRKPFEIEAVQITEENIEDVAKFVGELKFKDDGAPFIVVDRRLVPNIWRVFPGYWMTKMGDNIRCYSEKIFTEQFEPKNSTEVTVTVKEPLPQPLTLTVD